MKAKLKCNAKAKVKVVYNKSAGVLFSDLLGMIDHVLGIIVPVWENLTVCCNNIPFMKQQYSQLRLIFPMGI